MRLLLSFSFYFIASGATREKEVVANVDDSIWALNGDTVVLNCRHPVTGGDVWSQRAADGTLSAGPSAVRTINVGSTLTASMSSYLNGISYRCILTDFRGNFLFQSGWVSLFLGDEIRINCTNRTTACANVGETLKIYCDVTGLPEPNVTVSKISQKALSARLPSANRSGLTFSSVTLTDRGTYRLAANNVLQEISTDISVEAGAEICLAPVVDSFLIPDPVVCLQTARINFTAKGIPTPNVTWSAPSSKRIIIYTPTDSIDYDGITSVVVSSLEIRNVKRGDSIICVKADNGIPPSLQRCIKLNVTCDFDSPLVKLDDWTESSLSLQISDSPDDDRLQATEYFISYWQFTSLMKNLTIQRNPSGLTSVHLIDLHPNTSYNIRVVARNEPYHSQPADRVFATLKENDCIPTLQGVCAEPLMINWTYVCEGSQKLKEITSYVIVYESPKDYRRFSVEKVVTEYSFCDLHFNTTYNLSVIAVARNRVLRKSNNLFVSTNKFSEEVATVTTSPENTSLIVGVVVLGVLFVASGLIALYLFFYIRRSSKRNSDSVPGDSASKPPIEMQSSRLYESAKNVVSKGDSKQSSAAEIS